MKLAEQVRQAASAASWTASMWRASLTPTVSVGDPSKSASLRSRSCRCVMSAHIWQQPITLLRCQVVRQCGPGEAKFSDISGSGVLHCMEDDASKGSVTKYWCTAAVSDFRCLPCRHPRAMSQPAICVQQQCLRPPCYSQRQQSLWLALLLAAQSCWICNIFGLRRCRRHL